MRGFSRAENGDVIMQMSEDDYHMLLLALGIATGRTSTNRAVRDDWVKLVNRLNYGNPEFVPYEVK